MIDMQQINPILPVEFDRIRYISDVLHEPARFVVPAPDDISHAQFLQQGQDGTFRWQQQYQFIAAAVDQTNIGKQHSAGTAPVSCGAREIADDLLLAGRYETVSIAA